MEFPSKKRDLEEDFDSSRTSPERRKKLRQMIADSAAPRQEYMIMNVLSTIVAAFGLLQNSTAVVIGAMLIAMLLGPINGLALALNDGDWNLLRKAGIAEGSGALAVFFTALLIGKLTPEVAVSAEMMARTAPNILDLFIALAGGAAGAYAVATPRLKAGAVGVAIATALVPPLATAGLLMARGGSSNFKLGLGALILFITNLVTIQAAASGVFWFYGLHAPLRGTDKGIVELCRRNGISLGILVALGIFLAITFQNTIGKTRRDTEVRRMLSAFIQLKQKGSTLDDLNIKEDNDIFEVFAVIRTPNSFTPEQVAEIEDLLAPTLNIKLKLYIRSIITKEASSQGWLHVPTTGTTGEPTTTTAFPGDAPGDGADNEITTPPIKNSEATTSQPTDEVQPATKIVVPPEKSATEEPGKTTSEPEKMPDTN
jgi:uncharacterized hydrophobic protein (TIGR00341 family)